MAIRVHILFFIVHLHILACHSSRRSTSRPSLSQTKAALETLLGSSKRPVRSASDGSETHLVQLGAGRGSFSKGCSLYPGKRVVLVTVNSEYLEMFKNWLHYAKPFLQESEVLRVVAEEEDTVAHLKEMQTPSLMFDIVEPPSKAQSLLQGPFGSRDYGNVVWDRQGHMLELLEASCTVLYNDVDTVWLRDPFKDIDAAGPGSLYLTRDSTGGLCTCFMYVNPDADATTKLIRTWTEHKAGRSDQPVFNSVLPSSGVRVTMLPNSKFPAGNAEDRSTFKDAATVLHANWRIGIKAKIDFMKKFSVWVL